MVIVTGEPRCGTSLTMALLDRMGVPIACDDLNRGTSYETSGTGRPGVLPMRALREAQGSAIKLLCLPAQKRLREFDPLVVYLVRDAREQAASQLKFFAAAMPRWAHVPNADLLERFIAAQNGSMPEQFGRLLGRPALTLAFEDLVGRPEATCERLAEYVGVDPGHAWRHVRRRGPACAIDLSIELDLINSACREKEVHHGVES